jgi:hypothetical protein
MQDASPSVRLGSQAAARSGLPIIIPTGISATGYHVFRRWVDGVVQIGTCPALVDAWFAHEILSTEFLESLPITSSGQRPVLSTYVHIPLTCQLLTPGKWTWSSWCRFKRLPRDACPTHPHLLVTADSITAVMP